MSDIRCPKCQGPTWDETKSKFWDPTKNKPIAKCKDKACNGAVWAPKNGTPAAPQPSQAHNYATSPGAPAAFVAALGDQDADEQRFVEQVTRPVVTATDKLQTIFQLHDVCVANAVAQVKKYGLPPEQVSALAAQTFIRAGQLGIAA